MTTETKQQHTKEETMQRNATQASSGVTDTTTTTASSTPTAAPAAPTRERRNIGRRPRRDGGFGDRKSDVEQKILEIRRVTRVVAGGRRMSFAVSMVIGDKKGVVGVGTGKGGDTALAIGKALKDARKHAIKIKRTDSLSLPYDVSAKYCASKVILFPNHGKGLVAGAAVRDIIILAGLKDVSGKVVSGSKNKLNTARAVMKALAGISSKHSFTAAARAEAEAVPANGEESAAPEKKEA